MVKKLKKEQIKKIDDEIEEKKEGVFFLRIANTIALFSILNGIVFVITNKLSVFPLFAKITLYSLIFATPFISGLGMSIGLAYTVKLKREQKFRGLTALIPNTLFFAISLWALLKVTSEM